MLARFHDIDLTGSNFALANMKASVFENKTQLNRANFSGANLQKADFSRNGVQPFSDQLKHVLSVHETLAPNGSILEDPSLINYEKYPCDQSRLNGWIVDPSNFHVQVINQTDTCRFELESNRKETVVLSKTVRLHDFWNPYHWPLSHVLLSGTISSGVSIKLFGIGENNHTFNQITMSIILFLLSCKQS